LSVVTMLCTVSGPFRANQTSVIDLKTAARLPLAWDRQAGGRREGSGRAPEAHRGTAHGAGGCGVQGVRNGAEAARQGGQPAWRVPAFLGDMRVVGERRLRPSGRGAAENHRAVRGPHGLQGLRR
jgi:hypothetical protein